MTDFERIENARTLALRLADACDIALGNLQMTDRLDEVARTISEGRPNLSPDEILSLLGYIKTGIR